MHIRIESVEQKIDDFGDGAIRVLTRFVPFLVPLPSSFIIYEVTKPQLGQWRAGITGVIVELVGLVCMYQFSNVYSAEPELTSPRLKIMATIMSVIYLAVALGLTALSPHSGLSYAAVLFPLLNVTAAASLAIDAQKRKIESRDVDEAKKEIDKEDYAETKKIKRQALKKQLFAQATLPAAAQPQAIPTGNKTSNRELIKQYLEKHPEASRTEVIDGTGVTRATGNRILKEMGR